MVKTKEEIKKVAIYLRKSRLDDENDKDILNNHQQVLEEICQAKQWDFTIYKEDKSTTSMDIEIREQFNFLLENIDNFDAIMVFAQDRLSRETEDASIIKRILRQKSIFLIVKHNIYDLNDSKDASLYDFQAFFGSIEYAYIKDRLASGKEIRFSQGHWVNGVPPLPYRYNRNTHLLEIDTTELKLYNLIKDWYLNKKMSTNEIAFELNRQGKENDFYLTRSKNFWTNKTIIDTLTSEVHLGYVIRNKVTGSMHKNRSKKADKYNIIPKSDWKRVKGLHTPVKTIEEHSLILYTLNENRLHTMPLTKSKTIYSLTGLLRCGVCGSVLGFETKCGKPYIKKCHHKDEEGHKCRNSGCYVEKVEASILDTLWLRRMEYTEKLNDDENYYGNLKQLKDEINPLKKREKDLLERKKVVYDSYENKVYTVTEFTERRKAIDEELEVVSIRLNGIRLEIAKLEQEETCKDKLDKLNMAMYQLTQKPLTPIEKNELYKSLFHKMELNNIKQDYIFNMKMFSK